MYAGTCVTATTYVCVCMQATFVYVFLILRIFAIIQKSHTKVAAK